MSQALYRKYRSKTFEQVIGQEDIVRTLDNAIKSGQIGHAYLFSGPRGVGKTSIARIFAYRINGIEYTDGSMPVDIIEIDAASNRKIDEIRDLREKVKILPVELKYKVYIIDEVHMLTKEAFNALLKTLEEPPAHVIFILATTELEKLPETIVSRAQRYNFKYASESEIVNHLSNISVKENIQINEKALEQIAIHSGGSLRDSLSLLDQIRHFKLDSEITTSDIEESLGLPSHQLVNSLLDSLEQGETQRLIDLIKTSSDKGITANNLAKSINKEILYQLSYTGNHINQKEYLDLVYALLKVDDSHSPEILLEVTLVEFCLQNSRQSVKDIFQKIDNIDEGKEKQKKVKNLKIAGSDDSEAKRAALKSDGDESKKIISKSSDMFNDDTWQNVLEDIRKRHNTIYGILRMASIEETTIDNRTISLMFKFKFHQKRISEQKNKQIIIESLEKQGLKNYDIKCSVFSSTNNKELNNIELDTDQLSPVDANMQGKKLVKNIEDVFGQAEVI